VAVLIGFRIKPLLRSHLHVHFSKLCCPRRTALTIVPPALRPFLNHLNCSVLRVLGLLPFLASTFSPRQHGSRRLTFSVKNTPALPRTLGSDRCGARPGFYQRIWTHGDVFPRAHYHPLISHLGPSRMFNWLLGNGCAQVAGEMRILPSSHPSLCDHAIHNLLCDK
jgi:hypothetical protein